VICKSLWGTTAGTFRSYRHFGSEADILRALALGTAAFSGIADPLARNA
jgi:hypothetical protein